MPARKKSGGSAKRVPASRTDRSNVSTVVIDVPAKTASATTTGTNAPCRVKVRMYRQGLGDCFLLTFPRKDSSFFYVLIDCGVMLGTRDAGRIMKEVVEHIIQTTGGHIHVVVATHEHWDHISGFGQAREIWTDTSKLTIGEVWLSWAENPDDVLARKLRSERHSLQMALRAAVPRMALAGYYDAAHEVGSLLEFFGASGSTADALEVVKSLSSKIRYCTPKDAPLQLEGSDVTVYVLGPPPDERLIKKYNPSKREHETYGIDADRYRSVIDPLLLDVDPDIPFDARFQIPLEAAQQMTFFQQHYWGEEQNEPRDGTEQKDQSWRRIDGNWLDPSSALALQLDSATNNTCLVLAFELGDGDVLLFAADAQVGNWLSWQDLTWNVNGKEVTGPDLLRRTIFYKVGHHGSHNATLRELGLEIMNSLKVAFVPVDHMMAVKKRWSRMPMNELMDRLNQITEGRVVRLDADVPAKLSKDMLTDVLFHEVAL